ncbi:MAG: tetratricopeptide repeat protein [Caldithrix sp.]|nr:tetratricopeptide repeat protein [Caldithrix sp.]
MFSDLIQFLSGGVPGGLLLLFFVLFVFHLSLTFFNASKIKPSETVLKWRLVGTVAILLIYAIFWAVLRPAKPARRIIILPSRQEASEFVLSGTSLVTAQWIQNQMYKTSEKGFIVHRWPWLLNTIGRDSSDSYELWKRVALRLEPYLLIESIAQENTMQYIIHHDDHSTDDFKIQQNRLTFNLFEQLDRKYNLFKDFKNPVPQPSADKLDVMLAYHNQNYEQALLFSRNTDKKFASMIKAAVLMQKGLKQKKNRVPGQLTQSDNKNFQRAKRLLLPYIRDENANPFIFYIMGRMALREEKYSEAELFLKRGLIVDPTNSRFHYALSLLLPQRLNEFGYESRIEILKKAVHLDPGYTEAVYALADRLYSSGTGTPMGTGTQEALAVLEDYLKIRQNDPKILSLTASIYLKVQKWKKAEDIFIDLKRRFPENSNAYYNLGVLHYNTEELDQAKRYFKNAIQIDNNLDSYLYLGLIYKNKGKLDSALVYFRERVRRKTGDDDQFAKEAMLGIRQIIAEKQGVRLEP